MKNLEVEQGRGIDTHDKYPRHKILSTDQQRYLRRLGLSIGAVQLYELLHRERRLTAKEAAVLTDDFPSAKYRLFYELEKNQLVGRVRGRPLVFEALPIDFGLKASYRANQKQMYGLIGSNLDTEGTQMASQTELILGREALYDAYVRLAEQANHEILLFSIGIAYSELLERTQRRAIKRGVSVKHILQQRKLSNQYVVAKWLRAGVRLKYLKVKRGFHFFVIDNTHVCVTFSDPEDTENRLSILTDNPIAAELFIGQFRYMWQQAQTIVA